MLSNRTLQRWNRILAEESGDSNAAALLSHSIAAEAGLVLDAPLSITATEQRIIELDQVCRELDLRRFGIENPARVRVQLLFALWLEFAETQLHTRLVEDKTTPVPFNQTLALPEADDSNTEESSENHWSVI